MPQSSIIIFDAQPDDVYGIRHVQKVTWLATYPNPALGITVQDIATRFANDDTPEGQAQIEARKARLSDPNIHVWVARVVDAEHIEQSGEDVVGFCIAEHEPKNGRIGAIYVLPKYHGRGVGGKLMSTALGWLRNDGDIYVNVVSYNQHACSFYAHYDFVSTGRAVSDAVAVLPSGKTLPELEMVRKARI